MTSRKIPQIFKLNNFFLTTWVKLEDSVESVKNVVKIHKHNSYFHLKDKDIFLLQYINDSNQSLFKIK